MKKAAILLVSCFVFVACPAERYWSFCSYNLTKQDLFFVYDFFPYDDAITPGKNYCRCIKALDSARFVESGRIERTLKDSAHIYLIDAQKESLPSNWYSLSKEDIELIKEESFVARMTVQRSEIKSWEDLYWNFPSGRTIIYYNGYNFGL